MDPRRSAVICSYRLGMRDGVSLEAQKWQVAMESLGWSLRTVAGEGHADTLIPSLAASATRPPVPGEIEDAFSGAELVVVENLCSLPLNRAAGSAVAHARRGRPTVLRHHDLALERPGMAHHGPPPDDPAWRHVCLSDRAAALLAHHGISATVVPNAFPEPPPGRREATRLALGVAPGERLVLQPTRAIPRKDVPAGLALAEALGATYWLTGPAEDGYGPELDRVLGGARTRVLHRRPPGDRPGAGRSGQPMADAYAACDLVVLPSRQEGFGNPALEAATHRRPLAVGPYDRAVELRALGFSWFDLDDLAGIAAFLSDPDAAVLERDAQLARRHFSLADLPPRLEPVLESARQALTVGAP